MASLPDRIEETLALSENLIHFFKMPARSFGEKEVDSCRSLAPFTNDPAPMIFHNKMAVVNWT